MKPAEYGRSCSNKRVVPKYMAQPLVKTVNCSLVASDKQLVTERDSGYNLPYVPP
jgi:hypothetical protein